ncbi:hypothetical protein NDU88_004715 [Pleurodeles waltl]|uniref:Uncharacterized protein n=1 Tax=Pleurodeles waltl TaxID=8319 RepID=A0AAV7M735_PLEWA|nr:hypothetical protein NDU88_004715 [Pleurodeles waltl]
MDTAESFFSPPDQSKESDEEALSIDIDSAGSSAASIWRSNELTCRRKLIDSQLSNVCNQGGTYRGKQLDDREGAGELQWDYTATQQTYSKIYIADDLSISPMAGLPEQAGPSSLELIYCTMVYNHEQAQKDSRKAKIANKQVQSLIKRLVKSCHDISTCITTMETRTNVLETEVKAAVKQSAVQELQISDIQWKLEDAENHQRHNNVQILGLAEGLEGQVTRAYIVSLLKKAFPDLVGWNWEMEIQRAHRFPI